MKNIKINRAFDYLKVFCLLTLGIIIQSCSAAFYDNDDVKMEKIEESYQYQDGKFTNYREFDGMGFWGMFPVMWDFIFTGNDRSPDAELPVKQIDFSKIENQPADKLQVTWVGHSSQIINIDGKIVLTDPIYENSTAFMGPSRYNGDVPMNIDELPEIDLVLISHNHYDHLNTWTLEQIHKKVKHFVVPLMVGAELEDCGIPRDKITELDWWKEVILFDSLLVALTPAQHFSGRGLFDRDETLWGSFVVKGKYHSFYFSGDSGYFDGFKYIGNKYGPFDITFMECGAYNEKWSNIHMMPEETVQAHINVKGKVLHPIHWGTFNLALHPWYEPMVRVKAKADSLGIKLSTPIIGETIEINENLDTYPWWEEIIMKNSKLTMQN